MLIFLTRVKSISNYISKEIYNVSNKEMPIYQGGKAKIGKEIAKQIEIFEDTIGYKGQYLEPFCGLLGVGIHFAKEGRSVYANDINKDLILMLEAVKDDWVPPEICSKEEYDEYRKSSIHSAERGFYGFSCAYSGIFFAGYRIKSGKRNFFNTFRDGLLKMKPAFQNIKFTNKSYLDFHPNGMTIYCDPPYLDNGFRVKHFDNFNFEQFWQKMREWSKYNLVFISEQQAPDDFICIWEKTIKSGFNGDKKRNKHTEKLFMYMKE